MGYVVVVFAIINSAALIALALIVAYTYRELPMYVSNAIQDEVRRQDDRIEKRLAKREGGPEESDPNVGLKLPKTDGIRAGVPWRR